jgi:hypothetical protein
MEAPEDSMAAAVDLVDSGERMVQVGRVDKGSL